MAFVSFVHQAYTLILKSVVKMSQKVILLANLVGQLNSLCIGASSTHRSLLNQIFVGALLLGGVAKRLIRMKKGIFL